GMGVGQAHQFQETLHGAVLAESAMQRIKYRIRARPKQLIAGIVARIDADGFEAFLGQGLHHTPPGRERDLALGRASTHQDRDALERRHGATSADSFTPTRLISHSSATPWLVSTRRRTSSPKPSMSAALASPVLMRKLQCFSLTWAAPCISPRQPARSINCQAFWPGGFLKVEPPVLARMGWVASRAATNSSMRALIASGLSRVPSNTASTKTRSSAASVWR